MDMKLDFSRTNSVCVVLLTLRYLCYISLNYIKNNKFACVIFLFCFVPAKIVDSAELACYVGKQGLFRHSVVWNVASSASKHTNFVREQVFCCLVAGSLGESAIFGTPYGIHADDCTFGHGFGVMYFKLHGDQFSMLVLAAKVKKKTCFVVCHCHFKKHKANGHPRVRQLYPNVDLKPNIYGNIVYLASKISEGGFRRWYNQ